MKLGKRYLDVLRPLEMQKSKYLAVSTIKRIAKSFLHAATSCSLVGFAMIMQATTQLIGIIPVKSHRQDQPSDND